jgi:hypothetical protein
MVKKFEAKFYATMNWFEVTEQPLSLEDLPSEFAKAKVLWESNKSTNNKKIILLLEPYLKAALVLDNVTNWETLFGSNLDDPSPVIEAEKIKLVGIDFSAEPIPMCQAEASFKVQLIKNPATFDLEEWQFENAPLSAAVSFRWDVKRNSDTEDLDFTFGDHQGVDCALIEEGASVKKFEKKKSEPAVIEMEYAEIQIKGMREKDQELILSFLETYWASSIKNLEDLKNLKGNSVSLMIDKGWITILPNVIKGIAGTSDSVTVITAEG